VLYAFEIIMAFEFHNREFPCAAKSVIPAGSSYDNIDFQSCAYQSMGQGQLSLQGDEYLAQQFGFSYNNIGRNFGILILFIVGLLAINMWLVENVDWAESSGGGYEYAEKKGKAIKASNLKHDEETASCGETAVSNRSAANSHSFNEKSSSLPKSRAVFTWRDLDYTIQHEGGDKRLLNGVSGYCEPGKLTALVGASGAGKSTRKR
jgi:ABC-type multidrug transport system fused ATPase/permease subunit